LLRTDGKWRNGGRWLSLALLGSLAVYASPVEAAGSSIEVQSWITLTSGQLCRTWSAPTSAIRELYASIPSMAASAASANILDLTAAVQRSQTANGVASNLKAYTVTGANSVAITHCANQWHMTTDGHLVSDAPTWVPNPTGAWPVLDNSDATTLALFSQSLSATSLDKALTPVALKLRTASASAANSAPPARHRPSSPPPPPAPAGYGPPPGGVSPWVPVPGHPTYTFHDFAGDPYAGEYGVCTWWAWYMRRDEPLATLGMARDWIANARARGLPTGYAPRVGATVVFSPYVQGAGSGGHAAHVVAVLSNGWFIITEMNFYWNGGGWGRVDTRYVHTGSGVAFIY
jgi:CHAP domain-containing protein